MLRVRDSDDALAFEELVVRFQPRLLTILTHWCGNHEWAEDLSQDVFLRVFRARKQYSPQAKFSTWLFTIAHRVACNDHRSRARRPEMRMPDGSTSTSTVMGLDQLAVASSGQIPARRAMHQEMAMLVRQAVAELNDRQRMVVLLAKFEHMSYEEIATAMDLTLPAVKSLLSRARERLRELLQPCWEDSAILDVVPPTRKMPS